MRGFALARRSTVVSAKGPKTISAPACPFGSPAMLADSGGCATRSEGVPFGQSCAQTAFTSVYKSMASLAISRPHPDCL